MQEYQSGSQLGKFMGVPTTSITEEFVVGFASIVLFVTCVFAGLTLGAINTGKEADGVKYIPPLIIVSFALFFLIRFILDGIFANLFTILG